MLASLMGRLAFSLFWVAQSLPGSICDHVNGYLACERLSTGAATHLGWGDLKELKTGKTRRKCRKMSTVIVSVAVALGESNIFFFILFYK